MTVIPAIKISLPPDIPSHNNLLMSGDREELKNSKAKWTAEETITEQNTTCKNESKACSAITFLSKSIE